MNRVTPDNITELKEKEVFVFGSNLSGIHGGGAARTAINKFGAIWGQAQGQQGQSYAIPTKSEFITRTLEISEIRFYVDNFIDFAEGNPKLTFMVTEIGCGLAGLKPKQIAPLFIGTIEINNVYLPKRFWDELNHQKAG